MNLEFSLAHLSANAEAIAALARGISGEQARWRPSLEEWSILEKI